MVNTQIRFMLLTQKGTQNMTNLKLHLQNLGPGVSKFRQIRDKFRQIGNNWEKNENLTNYGT